MSTPRDHNGQPLARAFNYRAVQDRQINEMLGLLKGIVCDGVLNDDEIYAFRQWLQANPDAAVTWPGKHLAQRLVEVLADGRIDSDERHELYELFCETCGQGDDPPDENVATALPFCQPAPTVFFDNRTFVFTGAFVYGSRAQCEQAVADRGGRIRSSIVQEPLTLVIGVIGSRDWAQSAWGRKIEKAVEYRDRGLPIQIVSEEHWTAALQV